jgi:succinoglycan biosynthesis transport protein ExoP
MSNAIRPYRDRRLIERGRVVDRSPQRAPETGLDFGAIWSALRDGWWIVATACAVALIATAVFLLTATPRYEATSLVAIDINASPLPGTETALQRPSVEKGVGTLRNSGELARRVLERLDTVPIPAEVPGGDGGSDTAVPGAEGIESIRDLYERMSFGATSDGIIAITASGTEPVLAARLANLYAEAYKELSQEERRAGLIAARSFLESQLDQRQDDLRAIEQRWAAYVGSQQTASEGGQAAAQLASTLGQLRSVESQLQQERLRLQQVNDDLSRVGSGLVGALTSDLREQIGAIQERVAGLKLEAEEYYAVDPSLRGREDGIPELAAILTTIERLESRKTALAEQLAEQALSGDIADAGGGVDYAARLREQANAATLRIRQLEMEAAGLEGRAGALEAQLSGVPGQQVEVERINRERELTEEEYVAFVRQLQAIRVAEQAELGYVNVVRQAFPPEEPVWPKPTQSLILSGLLGLVFGGGLALLYSTTQQRLRQPEDLADHGFRLVGIVPPIEKEAEALAPKGGTVLVEGRSRSPKLLPLLSPWSPAAENYRLIRTNIQHGQLGRSPRTLLVTSPEMADGKTLTAVNLAVTMAQGGQRTLLIGADLRRPNAHTYLGIDRSPGLAEMLEGTFRVDAFGPDHLETGIERLYFLPAGRSETPPPELLGAERMREALAHFREAYDVVIVDAPPVLVVTDALLLAGLCDATVLVVTADRTTPGALEATRTMLENVGAEVTGTVLNRFAGRSDGAGHYGYGYKYVYAENES